VYQNQRATSIIFAMIIDACLTVFAYWLSWWVQFILMHNLSPVGYNEYRAAVRFVTAGMIFLFLCFGIYHPMTVTGRRKEALQILKAVVVGELIFLAVLFALSTHRDYPWAVYFSRRMVIRFGVFELIFTIGWRNIYRLILIRLRKSKAHRKNILMVGCGSAAKQYIDRVVTHQQWGLDIQGVLDDNTQAGDYYQGTKVLGPISELQDILDRNETQEIVITLQMTEFSKLEKIVNICERSGVHTVFIPDYNNVISTKPYTEDFLGLPMIHVMHVPLMEPGNRFIKRLMDIIGSILCIIIFSPVMIVTAIAVKVTSPGPVLFKQERVGLYNRPFKMYKFRSMTVQPPDEEVTKWTTRNDPRVTKVGKFIRKTSIDELPQLFNVLKGQMSLVGPRPERPFFVEKFRDEIPRYMVKHQVRPGMTGWAQVNGLRGDTSIARRIEFDIYYIEHWTLAFDFKILFFTVFRGFVNKNAY
jgi:Undecaprenyl-phosphate glucose phosphotransferase